MQFSHEINYIFLDYDGTIIENAEEEFLRNYFSLLSKKLDSTFDETLRLVMSSVQDAVANQDRMNLFEKFGEAISARSGKSKEYWIDKFLEFYNTDFDQLRQITQPNKEFVNVVNKTNKSLIFASNPLFPRIATYKRIQFAGLNPEMFYYVAHMENSTYAKPNPLFFKEIIEKLKLHPAECVMIGDSDFDKACEKVGIKFIHISEEEKWREIF
ncbi:HAD family hydrolase [Fervidobacterium gondwanense]|uniref:FMN phosphatase YigB, HAD superfamily n=1 Tax=Fervidobacterium gondwanense DSM 13020 TaxID=1121883 RepID=A0A1M7T8W2_FERGO|nr:HAD family hydrolase [Fervidobacterium gondwanense]SHN67166.1 FMN phosphatase YigB, HAD superfamily [Fervidobacterium gondwanense DSM 13020]